MEEELKKAGKTVIYIDDNSFRIFENGEQTGIARIGGPEA